jgi:hypothetical protein
VDRRLSGALVLVGALAAILTMSSIFAPGVSGKPQAVPLPDPPLIGQCLTHLLETVECNDGHRWEVVARWSATDPMRTFEAKDETCEQRIAEYGSLGTALTVGEWSLSTTIVATVIDAPAGARSGVYGWAVCGIRPAWVDIRADSLRGVASAVEAPELFGLCMKTWSNYSGVECYLPHDEQLLGRTRDKALDTLVRRGTEPYTAQMLPPEVLQEKKASCEQLAVTVTGAPDPTFGGKLRIRVAIDPLSATSTFPVTVIYTATCSLAATGRLLLDGTLIGLGDRPLPLLE